MNTRANMDKYNFNRRKRRKVIEVEEVKVEESSLLSNIFPLLIIGIFIGIFGLLYYLLFNYEEVQIVDGNGFFLNINDSLLMGNKKNPNSNNKLEVTQAKENDIIYKNKLNYYFINERKNSINYNYPLFSNDGLSIINYNENTNLIDSTFERSEGYSTFDFKNIDNNNYLLLMYADNIGINLYDLKITTTANEYLIPTNSFVYFENNKINYYERNDNNFIYKEILDVDYNSTIEFYYEGAGISHKYSYEEFLSGTDTVYIPKSKPSDEVITPDNPQEEAKPKNDNKKNGNVKTSDKSGGEPGKIIWEKPSVKISNINPNVFSLTANLEIKDPAGVIVKAPTFTVYKNNKIYMKRTYYSDGNILMNGLTADNEFLIVGQYTYLAENLEDNIISTFYRDTIKTKSLSSLSPIDVSLKNGNIYSKKIEIKDVKVISDLTSEALKGVNRMAISIEGKNYFLTNTQVNAIINGETTNLSTSESLNSAQKINYTLKFFDKENNSLVTTGTSGQTRTSKLLPNVNIRVLKSEIDEVSIGVNVKNEDDVELNNFKYIVKASNGKIIKEGYVENTFVITDLDPDQIFNLSVFADIDIDDGNGLLQKY